MWLGVPGHDRRLLRIRLSYYPINALYIRLTRPVSVTSYRVRASRSLSRSLTLTLLVFVRRVSPFTDTLRRVHIMYIYYVYIIYIRWQLASKRAKRCRRPCGSRPKLLPLDCRSAAPKRTTRRGE